MVKVFPGEYYVTAQDDEVLVTILGSCVSACIRDPHMGIGGMNHFMLAEGEAGGWGGHGNSTRYGNFAMEKLLNELLKMGCSRSALEIKVFGGGNVTDTRNLIGTDNSDFVMRYLENEGLKCRRAGSARTISAPDSVLPEDRTRCPPAAGWRRVQLDRARRNGIRTPSDHDQDGRHNRTF